MSAPETPSPLLIAVRAYVAKHGGPAPQSAKPSAPKSERAALMAKLEAATDNNTRWNLAEAINNLPVEGAF